MTTANSKTTEINPRWNEGQFEGEEHAKPRAILPRDFTEITNHVPRPVLGWLDLTTKERAEFDYLDTEDKQWGAQFARYRGNVYDLGEFQRYEDDYWHGIATDSYFSATVMRLEGECDYVVMGRVYS